MSSLLIVTFLRSLVFFSNFNHPKNKRLDIQHDKRTNPDRYQKKLLCIFFFITFSPNRISLLWTYKHKFINS